MTQDSSDKAIISLLAENERAVGRLYQTYADKFPTHREFWLDLANEEQQHAEWLRRLLVRVEEGLGCVRPDRFDVDAARDARARVEKMIEETHRPDFSLTDALRAAMTIEKSLIEAEYFDVFEGAAAEVVQVQYCLADATKNHRRLIEEQLAEQTGGLAGD